MALVKSNAKNSLPLEILTVEAEMAGKHCDGLCLFYLDYIPLYSHHRNTIILFVDRSLHSIP